MTGKRSAHKLPTLTEVVDVSLPLPETLIEGEMRRRILADVQRQVDQFLEMRLREALGPALTRLTDALVRDARSELASALRDVVARAVAQELSRHRES